MKDATVAAFDIGNYHAVFDNSGLVAGITSQAITGIRQTFDCRNYVAVFNIAVTKTTDERTGNLQLLVTFAFISVRFLIAPAPT